MYLYLKLWEAWRIPQSLLLFVTGIVDSSQGQRQIIRALLVNIYQWNPQDRPTELMRKIVWDISREHSLLSFLNSWKWAWDICQSPRLWEHDELVKVQAHGNLGTLRGENDGWLFWKTVSSSLVKFEVCPWNERILEIFFCTFTHKNVPRSIASMSSSLGKPK